MGSDSTPRKVLSLSHGRGEMFRIDQTKGDSYTVNKNHILSLKKTREKILRRGILQKNKKGEIVNISVEEYLDKSKYFKWIHKGYKVAVDFPNIKVDFDPYFLGLWLGDGSSNSTEITTMDKEIIDYLKKFCKENKLECLITLTKSKAITFRISNNYHNHLLNANFRFLFL